MSFLYQSIGFDKNICNKNFSSFWFLVDHRSWFIAEPKEFFFGLVDFYAYRLLESSPSILNSEAKSDSFLLVLGFISYFFRSMEQWRIQKISEGVAVCRGARSKNGFQSVFEAPELLSFRFYREKLKTKFVRRWRSLDRLPLNPPLLRKTSIEEKEILNAQILTLEMFFSNLFC